MRRKLLLLAGLAGGYFIPRAKADIQFMLPRVRATTTAGSAQVTGTTAETSLVALLIPAGAMGANGVIELTTLWSYTNSANAKTLIVRFNSSAGAVAGGLLGTNAAPTSTPSAQMMHIVRNNNATGAQIVYGGFGTGPFGAAAQAAQALTVDTTANSYLNLNGQLAVGTEQITLVHACAVIFGN